MIIIMYDNKEHCQVFFANFHCIILYLAIGLIGGKIIFKIDIRIRIAQSFGPVKVLLEAVCFGRTKALHELFIENFWKIA